MIHLAFFFFKQKTAYEIRPCDWSSDVCSSDLGAIFDGFPRTAAQAELVDTTLGERGQRLSKVLLLDVPEEELIRRLTARAAQENRSDDTPEAIRTRLQVYQRDTAPLVAHYAQRGIVHRVPGTGTIEGIATEIQRLIGR